MKKMAVLGLGAGDLEQMPLGLYRKIQHAKKLYVRTSDHPAVQELLREGIEIESFDSIYESYDQFEDVYEAIVRELLLKATEEEVIYAVPGHPFVAERTVQLLVDAERNGDIQIDFLGGQSFLDEMYTAFKIDPIDGLQILDGTSLKREEVQIRHHLIVVQVYDAFIASEVKLTLMELLPDDYPVYIATAVGSKDEVIEKVALFELDRVTTLNNLTAVYVPPVEKEEQLYRDFHYFRDVIATLRGPEGCPWDQKQTHESLKRYLIEESYELLEAIDLEQDEHIVEELGDVFLQVMLHAQIGEDEGLFTIDDVIAGITDKMIRRHPHVFSSLAVDNEEEVIQNWEAIKQEEKGNRGKDESYFSDITPALPSLMHAFDIQKKASKVGFDWADPAPIWMKLQEEIGEFLIEAKADSKERMQAEFGDILFVLVNLARHYDILPEVALRSTNEKFMKRFNDVYKQVTEMGKKLEDVTLEEMDVIWEESKRKYQ